MAEQFESSNINGAWLMNIYENIKNLEKMERIANEGCHSLMDYFQIPAQERKVILPDMQYKNLRFIVTELKLLLIDLTPVVKENAHKDFMKSINHLRGIVDNRKIFVVDNYSVQIKGIASSKLTPFFWETLNFTTLLKQKIIKEIAHLLYIDTNKGGKRNRKPWEA